MNKTPEYATLPIEDVWFDEAESDRQEMGEIGDLAASIEAVGLIHPIVVTRQGKIVVGRRRYKAHKRLKRKTINVQYADTEISPLQTRLMELEENIKRKALTWQEEAESVSRLHKLRREVDPEWDQNKTAKFLCMAPSTVSGYLKVAREIESGNTKVAKASKLSEAQTIVRRSQSRALDQISVDAIPEPEETELKVPLYQGDFISWCSKPPTKFNFLHCDFPYGIKVGGHGQTADKSLGSYDDDPDVYWNLLHALSKVMDVLVADSAHMMFWFSMDYYAKTKSVLEKMGWKVNPFPLVWHKSDNRGVIPDHTRYGRRTYETAFHCARGDRLLVKPAANSFSGPTTKIIHMSEKPRAMLRHFMSQYIDESTVMLDPTCGSGNAVRVAQDLKAMIVMGLEKDPEHLLNARAKFYEDI